MWGYDMEFDGYHWVLFIELSPLTYFSCFFWKFKKLISILKRTDYNILWFASFCVKQNKFMTPAPGMKYKLFCKNWCNLKDPFLYFWVFCMQKCMVIMSNRTSTIIVEFTFRSSGFWIYGRAWNLTKPFSKFCLDKIQKN